MSQIVYTSQQVFEDKGSTVLVVACSSYVTLPYVREFLDQHLKLPEGTYNLLAVPGGPQFMALTEYLPKFAWVGQKWINFAIDKLQVRRIILISHQDCSWYADERFVPALLHKLGHHDQSPHDRQRDDLKATAASLRSSLHLSTIEAYFVEKAADGRLTFTCEA
jgi:hypothetical protein